MAELSPELADTGDTAPVVPAGGDGTSLIQYLERAKMLPGPESVEKRVAELKAARPNATPGELSRSVVKATTRKITTAGAAAALPATIPMVGTGASLATIPPEMWFVIRQLNTMQLTVAALHGHDPHHLDREDELVAIWALATRVVEPATRAVTRVGTKVAISQFNRKVSGKVFQRINQRAGATVLTKWGIKRGGIAVGRLIPFGVGAAVGGGVNYVTSKAFGRHVLKFYGELYPSDAELIVLS